MNRIRAGLMALGVALAATACASSHPASQSPSTGGAATDDPLATAATVAAGGPTTPCTAFDQFLADLNRLTPHGGQATLIADVEAMQGLLPSAPTLSAAESRMVDDVTALAAHVGSSTWPDQGTPVDPEILAVQSDCA
jgi:hypothetical protein